MGLIHSASSARSSLTRIWIRQERTLRPITLSASAPIAGRNDVNAFPSEYLALRGRNVYPRNVNVVCSYEPRRRESLQYTIFVLSGCRRSPDFFHPLGERGQHLTCLPLGRAMHH